MKIVSIGCHDCENIACVDMSEAQEEAPLKFCPFCGSDEIEDLTDES